MPLIKISIDELIPVDELRQIELNFMDGRYAHLADCLRQFLINHSSDILRFRGELEHREARQFPLESVIGLYILENKTVDMKLDMRDQKREIENTIWYEHEKGRSIPASEIEKEWVRKYAAAWRTHRTREIMYVFSQNKQEYLRLVIN
ncbi:MAG: hypothetical protein MUF61_03100 [archaeon]|jgi:hypothetical protein|nr:hypothetical protein [archaeon]